MWLPLLQRHPGRDLRLKKEFTERDQYEFLRSGFNFIAWFFGGSPQALATRNPGVKGAIDHIDSRRFSAVLYEQGKVVSECSIRLNSMDRRGGGIAFSYDASAREGTYNEMLQLQFAYGSGRCSEEGTLREPIARRRILGRVPLHHARRIKDVTP